MRSSFPHTHLSHQSSVGLDLSTPTTRYVPGDLVDAVYQAAVRETGVAASTLGHYVQTRHWKATNRPLKVHARTLARALDIYRLQEDPVGAMDIAAGRLRALIHFDISGKWREAEQLQAYSARDTGLTDFSDLYMAKRMARLTGGGESSSSEEEERAPQGGVPAVKKKKKKRGKKKAPKEGADAP
mgnify:CR=1 FL=1